MCFKMCSPNSTRPSRHTFGACARARHLNTRTFHGAHRYNSFSYKEFGNGATLEKGTHTACLIFSKIGRIAMRWSRPIEGIPKVITVSSEADGYFVCISCAAAPTHLLAPTGQETGMDLGLESFAMLADGTPMHNPRCHRRAERRLKTA
jgi:putative transposase